jgi:imidazolonepropionase-like amidohydrolase
VVEDGRIADVGVGLTGPSDALVIDVAGQTLMPGLIDAHTHPMSVAIDFNASEWSPVYVAARAGRALEGMLARGFTTIRGFGTAASSSRRPAGLGITGRPAAGSTRTTTTRPRSA